MLGCTGSRVQRVSALPSDTRGWWQLKGKEDRIEDTIHIRSGTTFGRYLCFAKYGTRTAASPCPGRGSPIAMQSVDCCTSRTSIRIHNHPPSTIHRNITVHTPSSPLFTRVYLA